MDIKKDGKNLQMLGPKLCHYMSVVFFFLDSRVLETSTNCRVSFLFQNF